MRLKKWNDLPDDMKNDSVKKYYELLYKKRHSLCAKRIFDITVAMISFIILFPVFLVLSIAIKVDSRGPVLFCQTRVTQYGKRFKIFKFRTMIDNADKTGAQITVKNDARITNIGRVLRKYRLDEIPQLFNIILGDMSFVGTRPEVVKYVEKYKDEMKATMLLPAGVTSEASIQYKDEELLLVDSSEAESIYVNELLPEKMKYNLRSLEEFNFWGDIIILIRTAEVLMKRENTELPGKKINEQDSIEKSSQSS
ncbi:MAG: sugar transferase [Sedimentibacter sp.]|jgi:lipopolysaccharide/colanic/teichoic acid biosynthesis glycosyltransferase|nr:sugar transferase [Sedimentibacter sp.]